MITRKRFLKLSFLSSLLLSKQFRPRFQVLNSNLNFLDEKGKENKLKGFKKDDTQYFSLNHLAEFLCLSENGDRFLYVEKKQKLVVVKNKQRIIFSADNTFVKINDHFYQLFIPTILVDEEIYISVSEFIELMNSFSSINFSYQPSSKKLAVDNKGYSITGLSYESKKNGVSVRIIATKDFPLAHVQSSVKQAKDKLYLSILNAELSVKSIERLAPNPYIKRVQAFQFENSGQIVFTVVGKLNRNLINIRKDDGSFDLLLSFGAKMNQKQKNEVELKKKDESLSKKLDKEHDKLRIDTIIIDAGHGGKDSGAIGKIGRSRVYEKTVVLDIAKKIKSIIKNQNPRVKIILTRSKDEYIKLAKRGKIANQNKGKLFISLHCNANRNVKANGFETYVVGTNKDEKAARIALTENKVVDLYEGSESKKQFEGINFIRAKMLQSAYVKHSFYLAEIIDEKVGVHMKSLAVKNRGVKQAPFYVLYGPSMPSVLIETAFISNRREVKLLASKNERSKIAKSVAWAIMEYKRDIDSTV